MKKTANEKASYHPSPERSGAEPWEEQQSHTYQSPALPSVGAPWSALAWAATATFHLRGQMQVSGIFMILLDEMACLNEVSL